MKFCPKKTVTVVVGAFLFISRYFQISEFFQANLDIGSICGSYENWEKRKKPCKCLDGPRRTTFLIPIIFEKSSIYSTLIPDQ